jgi:SAM-dependent methyltransferase
VGNALRAVDDLDELGGEGFDYLFAFEVLEHIEHDLDALQEWTERLKPWGRLLVSVPGHQRKYGPEDASVGHVRRHEREDLKELLVDAGNERIEIFNYGFPLGNMTRVAHRMVLGLCRRGRMTTTDLSLSGAWIVA